jgi:hypothetical protein
MPDASSTDVVDDKTAVAVPTSFPVFNRKTPYGYVFTAATLEDACSVLVAMTRLRVFRSPHRVFVLVTDAVPKEYVEEMEALGAMVSAHDVPVHPHREPVPDTEEKEKETERQKRERQRKLREKFWLERRERGLLRLLAFRMHQMDSSLKRVLYVDSDVFIYKGLDSIFDLPDVDVAAPRAYWREGEEKGRAVVSSSFMLITLGDRVWNRVHGAIKDLKKGEYDGELVNRLFGETAMVLPGQYLVVDHHWLNWDIPAWFRPEADSHSEGMVEKYSEASLNELWRIINLNVGNEVDGPARRPSEVKRARVVKREEGSEELTELRKLRHSQIVSKRYLTSSAPPDQTEKPEATPTNSEETLKADETTEKKKEEPAATTTTSARPKPSKPIKPTPKPPLPYTKEDHPNKNLLFSLQDRIAVLQYASGTLPWEKNTNDLRKEKADAHNTMYEQFRHWRENAVKVCPRVAVEDEEVGKRLITDV